MTELQKQAKEAIQLIEESADTLRERKYALEADELTCAIDLLRRIENEELIENDAKITPAQRRERLLERGREKMTKPDGTMYTPEERVAIFQEAQKRCQEAIPEDIRRAIVREICGEDYSETEEKIYSDTQYCAECNRIVHYDPYFKRYRCRYCEG